MRSTRASARFLLALPVALVGALVVSSSAWAQAPPPAPRVDKVAAEALFEDGRRLLAAGAYGEACPKFAESEALDPSPGTLLNLASCYEKLGRSATAWATYREAASAANAAGRAEYVATAQRHADALAPKLARLTVSVAQPVDGLQVSRDGAPVDRAVWGTAIPIDPGSHTIDAAAPGRKGWSSAIEVRQDGAQVSVSVPALEALPLQVEPPPVAPVTPPSAQPQPAPPAPEQTQGGGGGQRAVGIVVGTAGIVGLGVGVAFAVMAKSKYNGSLSNCESGNVNLCNATGVSQRDDARSAGNVASVAVAVGAAALAAGVVVWLTAPRGSSTLQRGDVLPTDGMRVGVIPTPGGALLQGAW